MNAAEPSNLTDDRQRVVRKESHLYKGHSTDCDAGAEDLWVTNAIEQRRI